VIGFVTGTAPGGLPHTAQVEAESLYEAAVLGVQRLRGDPWTSPIGPSTPLEIEVREPGAFHVATLAQVQRWLDGATTNPNEEVRKVQLKGMLRSGQFRFPRLSFPRWSSSSCCRALHWMIFDGDRFE
jgi:hypothetical protein